MQLSHDLIALKQCLAINVNRLILSNVNRLILSYNSLLADSERDFK